MNKDPKPIDWLVLFILGGLWGSAFVFIKHAVESFDPFQMTFLRMGLSTLIYLPIFVCYVRRIDWSKWKVLLAVALCGYGVPNYFFALAEQHGRVSSGVAGVLNSLVPLLALTIGVLFFQVRTTRTKVAGIALGFSGAAWLVVFARNGGSAQPGYAALCILAATMYALNANLIGHYLRGLHPLAVGGAAFSISGPFYFWGVWKTGALEVMGRPENRTAMWAVVYLAIASTVIANAVYTWLVQRTSPVFATSVAYLFPIFSLAIGSFVGEPISWIQGVGALLILGGLYLSRKS